AFAVLRRRWWPFFKTGILLALRLLLGFFLGMVPMFVMMVRYYLCAPVELMERLEVKAARTRARALASRSWRTIILVILIQFMVPIVVHAIIGALIGIQTSPKSRATVRFKIGAQFTELLNVFILPLISIVPALLYLKMRQFGGETLSDVMAQIENVEGARSNWQQRMRTRLIVNTPKSFG